MATNGVLKEAIKKLEFNNKVLKTKKLNSQGNKAIVEKLDRQIAQNDSMILDYQYRLKNNLG